MPKPDWIKRDIIQPSNDFEREAVVHAQRVLRCAETDGKMNEETVTRLRGLQMLFRLPVTGALDIRTAEQIERIVNQHAIRE